jgi:hypothetical protein
VNRQPLTVICISKAPDYIAARARGKNQENGSNKKKFIKNKRVKPGEVGKVL